MGDLLSSQWSFHRSYRWSELSKKKWYIRWSNKEQPSSETKKSSKNLVLQGASVNLLTKQHNHKIFQFQLKEQNSKEKVFSNSCVHCGAWSKAIKANYEDTIFCVNSAVRPRSRPVIHTIARCSWKWQPSQKFRNMSHMQPKYIQTVLAASTLHGEMKCEVTKCTSTAMTNLS